MRMSVVFIVAFLIFAVCLLSGCWVMFVLYCVLYVELVRDSSWAQSVLARPPWRQRFGS